ncbi:GntR family transcriptional regulator [Microbispora sp. NPDC046933]|uniref:GntR family transcriptional regulator n=1 Tax=Microbispora sp. NPDC046933 TaxID=3155618 RepID=UPI0033DAD53D
MNGVGERLTGRERALTYLREVVLSDPAREGTFVNEQQLAEDVGLSRTPVREALLILASEGLLQMLPQRGVYISPLSAREIRELMELRGVIERYAVTVPGLDAEATGTAMLGVLEEQAAMAGDASRRDAKAFIELDRRFHQLMVDAAGSSLLSRTYAGLRERQVRVGIAALRAGDGRWRDVCLEHRAIAEAVRAGAVADAHAAIDAHLRMTSDALLAV